MTDGERGIRQGYSLKMDRHTAALGIAGVIGCVVAVIHGVLTHRLMVRPLDQLTDGRVSVTIRRLVPLLLQFSTYNWFLSGIALLVATQLDYEARLMTGVLAASSYLFGALGNLWATRKFHPGWVLYGVALLLIAYGLGGFG
jgi:hypothetical protein